MIGLPVDIVISFTWMSRSASLMVPRLSWIFLFDNSARSNDKHTCTSTTALTSRNTRTWRPGESIMIQHIVESGGHSLYLLLYAMGRRLPGLARTAQRDFIHDREHAVPLTALPREWTSFFFKIIPIARRYSCRAKKDGTWYTSARNTLPIYYENDDFCAIPTLPWIFFMSCYGPICECCFARWAAFRFPPTRAIFAQWEASVAFTAHGCLVDKARPAFSAFWWGHGDVYDVEGF